MSVMVVDGLFDPQLIDAAERDWPAEDWDGWLHYESPFEDKLTCNATWRMPSACRRLLSLMQALRGENHHDLSLYGGGMHAMPSGGRLDVHLDCDMHPHTGRQRRQNAILFVNKAWDASWGGRLEVWDDYPGPAAHQIAPRRGRLVIFDTHDQSHHAVEAVRCPPGVQRKTLAVYFWGPVLNEPRRPRALFVPRPKEKWPAIKLAIARERAGLAVP